MKEHSDHTQPKAEKANSKKVDTSACSKPMTAEGAPSREMKQHPDHTGKPAPRVND